MAAFSILRKRPRIFSFRGGNTKYAVETVKTCGYTWQNQNVCHVLIRRQSWFILKIQKVRLTFIWRAKYQIYTGAKHTLLKVVLNQMVPIIWYNCAIFSC